MIINDIIISLEAFAPLKLQESYDNSGLIVGSRNTEIDNILISLDVTEAVVDEAIEYNCGLIVSHHPIIFKGLKKITGSNSVERIIEKAIKNNIALYAIHTNLDNISKGVNSILAKKLGITNTKILQPGIEKMYKIITFCPHDNVANVMDALFKNGAGNIGNYDSCGFTSQGTGTFRPLEGSSPYVGDKGKLHFESETKIESIISGQNINKAIKAMIDAHPYEQAAYDIIPLQIDNPETGAGMIGELPNTENITDYLKKVKKISNVNT